MIKLGKYLLRRELGKGAMGVVYEGFDPVIQRTVAIKTLIPSELTGSETIVTLARFKREAQAAGRLNHPGIVAIYDYGEAVAEDDLTMVATPGNSLAQGQKIAFIAMEFVVGLELKDYFDRAERFSLHAVQRLMCEILDALDHAHGNGVTHRDIKPSNLIMLANGKIKVADFGIARIETSELTQAGTIMGTPSYMSPEQFMGQDVDRRSDLFSCGVILYQFLTGEKPFTGTTSTIMFKVLREDPLPPSALNPLLPTAWDQVTKRAMAKNPDDRFQTAQEFAMAVQAAAASGLPNAEPSLDAPDIPAKRAKLTRLLWVLFGVLVLLFGALGAWLLPGDPKEAARVPAAVGAAPLATGPKPVAAVVVEAVEPMVPAAPVSSTAAASAPQNTKVKSQGKPVAPAGRATAATPTPTPTAPVPVNAVRPARCALIIQKASVDEPISPAERSFLSSSCQ